MSEDLEKGMAGAAAGKADAASGKVVYTDNCISDSSAFDKGTDRNNSRDYMANSR